MPRLKKEWRDRRLELKIESSRVPETHTTVSLFKRVEMTPIRKVPLSCEICSGDSFNFVDRLKIVQLIMKILPSKTQIVEVP